MIPYPKYVQSLADKIEELENRFGNRYVNTSCTVVCFCNDAVLIQIELASFKSRLAVLQEVQQQQQQHGELLL